MTGVLRGLAEDILPRCCMFQATMTNAAHFRKQTVVSGAANIPSFPNIFLASNNPSLIIRVHLQLSLKLRRIKQTLHLLKNLGAILRIWSTT